MKRSIDMLETRMIVDCDDAALTEGFFHVFANFASPAEEPAPSRTIRVRVDGADGRFEGPERSVCLAPGRLRAVHVYNLLYTTLLRSIAGAYLLHAAAVGTDRGAILIGGPGGSGKTTLALALARRGFPLLSDDISPLVVADGRIHPFPRCIGIAGGDEPSQPSALVGDKWFVGPETMEIETESRPVPPRAIVLMNPFPVDPTVVRLTVGVLVDADDLARRLATIRDVRVDRKPSGADVAVLGLELRGGEAYRAAERVMIEAQDSILFNSRESGAQKRYADSPELETISIREAAVGLMQEALNREPSGSLMKRHSGSLVAALFELTGLIRQVGCHRLVPSTVEATADLLAGRFGRSS